MKLRLIPKEDRFFDLFVEDAATALGAARLLDTMLRSYDELERRAAEIRGAEVRGDALGREILDRLEGSFVQPFGRADVHALVRGLDGVVDAIEEVADTFVIYRIEAPTAAAVDLAALLVRGCETIHSAMNELESFSGLAAWRVEIDRLDDAADAITRTAIAALFDGDDPIHIIKWRKVYGLLGAAMDRCADVADILERIALRNA
jgi:uncharacterized protein